MKIECDKCGAKYSIADDKVRGKTFKIRCKKCSNVIIVRDKAGGGDAAESEAPADEPGWHLAIGGETVGPLTEAEVRERHAAGEIDRETSVWQEGFEDWLPLGDVGAFSDLVDRSPGGGAAAAAAPDPFAAGGDDDYGRGSFGGGGGDDFARSPEPARAAPAAAASTPAAASPKASSSAAASGKEGDSPRVSQLTSTRNENSVLFSLDSLSSMAMGSGGKPSGGASSSPSSFSTPVASGGGGGSHSPSASGNSEGSGLIDIRSMGAMLGGGGGGGGGGGADDDRDDSMLPSFGGTGFGGLAAAPLLTATPASGAPEPVVVEPQRSSQTPLYIIIGILVLGMGGLAAYVLTRPPPQPTEVVRTIVAPAVQSDKDDDGDEDGEKKKKKKTEDEDEGDEEAEAGAPAAEAGETPTAVTKTGDKKGTTTKSGDKKGTTTTKTGDKKGTDSGTTPTTATETKTETKKPAESDNTPSVECILDPSKCKKGGSTGTTTKPPPDASMPEKLELADIKAGVAGPKSSAESSCKSKAKGGEKVKIKLSINGPAGTVISSSAEDDGGNPALGSCVAAELKKATFKKVQKEQIGTVVSVSF